ncbi:MAG TPA: Uma2 family endonuclease [Chloroflexota bacterium]|nr:Uma2 family endonuclease [Chloroflexota bacterium]
MTLQATRPLYTRRRFTVDEYYRLAEVGILREDERVELVDGEIIVMSPIGRLHAADVDRLGDLFVITFRDSAQVRVQNPLRLDEHSEPQPDVMLLRRKPDFYRSGHPRPEDVLLLVEVADSTLAYDREVKLPLYARFGIPEVWLLDVENDAIVAHRDPSPDGYRTRLIVRRGASLAPLAFPGRELAVAEMLG